VSVVVPFRGDRAGAEALVESLGRLRTESGDELIVADNTPVSVIPDDAMPGLRVVKVPAPQSARRARNEGARLAANPWLLFLDADCRPAPELLDEYFDSEPVEGCGVIAGEVVGDPGQPTTLARWARSRRGEMARYHLETGSRPAGIAGNLMLRRVSFQDVGGFEERARSEADVDLCWRVQEAGWTLEYRPRALVTHRDPERLRGVLRQAWMYGAGRRWLHERWGSAAPPPPIAVPLARALAGTVAWTLTARFERALFKLVDGLVSAAGWLGYATARVRGVG
jgi:glycosyltransferase involved in cell wall biosynthesis